MTYDGTTEFVDDFFINMRRRLNRSKGTGMAHR